MKLVHACAAAVVALTGMNAEAKKPKPVPPEAMAQFAKPVAKGRVVQYLLNPHGEVDGLLIEGGIVAKFPPHMGEALAAEVRPGDTVDVIGFMQHAGLVKAYTIANERTGKSVTDVRPDPTLKPMPKHLRGAQLTEQRVTGRVAYQLFAPKGEPSGVILEDGTVVKIDKNAAYRNASLLQVGQSMSAWGYGTQNRFGRALEATAIGAAGTQPASLYRGR